MSNNQQADSLVGYKIYTLYSNSIEISKKDIKKLKTDSWLKIDSDFLDVVIVKDEKIKYIATLNSNGSYFFLDISKSKDRIYEQNKCKNSFILKYIFSKEIFKSTIALAKSPLSAILLYKGKEFAKIELYISDSVYMKIKDIL